MRRLIEKRVVAGPVRPGSDPLNRRLKLDARHGTTLLVGINDPRRADLDMQVIIVLLGIRKHASGPRCPPGGHPHLVAAGRGRSRSQAFVPAH